VPEHKTYDYAIVRVVPKVEREEFLNVGVIVSSPANGFLEARIELNERRLLAIDPTVDLETIRAHLATIPAICAGGPEAGPIGSLPQRERFHWLVASRSTVIQTSPAHTGTCENPATLLEHLLETMVRTSDRTSTAVGVRVLPYTSLAPLLREHLLPEEDEETAELVRRIRAARRRGYLTKGELERVCRWKSPRALGLVLGNDHHRVRRATNAALRARSEQARLDSLLELRGVSVPTASAILTMLDPARYGVIDIRVWQLLHAIGAVDGNRGGTNLTFVQWDQFLGVVRHFARELDVTARTIERTLFAVHRKYQEGLLY
jgi:hypothetical protein